MPISRSRATESAVTTMVTTSVNRATMPGTMNQRLNRLGLNQARVTRLAGGPGWPWATSHSRLNSLRIWLA